MSRKDVSEIVGESRRFVVAAQESGFWEKIAGGMQQHATVSNALGTALRCMRKTHGAMDGVAETLDPERMAELLALPETHAMASEKVYTTFATEIIPCITSYWQVCEELGFVSGGMSAAIEFATRVVEAPTKKSK